MEKPPKSGRIANKRDMPNIYRKKPFGVRRRWAKRIASAQSPLNHSARSVFRSAWSFRLPFVGGLKGAATTRRIFSVTTTDLAWWRRERESENSAYFPRGAISTSSPQPFLQDNGTYVISSLPFPSLFVFSLSFNFV